jgi:hypothetical protein
MGPRCLLSLLDFCLGVKRAPPHVDRAEIEAQVEPAAPPRQYRKWSADEKAFTLRCARCAAAWRCMEVEMSPDALW